MELKAKELQLGKYVYGHMNEICIVEQLGSTLNPNLVGYREVANIKSYGQNSQSGIPLTNEWFRNFKFKELESNFVSERFKFMYKKGDNYWYVVDRLSLTYLTKIEFVHELQNFMFVMDSAELKLQSDVV